MLHRKFYDICFVAHFHGGKQFSVGEGNGNTEVVVSNQNLVSNMTANCHNIYHNIEKWYRQ